MSVMRPCRGLRAKHMCRGTHCFLVLFHIVSTVRQETVQCATFSHVMCCTVQCSECLHRKSCDMSDISPRRHMSEISHGSPRSAPEGSSVRRPTTLWETSGCWADVHKFHAACMAQAHIGSTLVSQQRLRARLSKISIGKVALSYIVCSSREVGVV